ncbi:hypothetical protein AAE02nite_32070 [Adhaeribacter aerolatus]|uniref:Antitoxin SocA-like Panacea domain-containing protein n=1 Tax=Adhaeribacter aerolatus TaxID=670289 RepID=A0A512B0Q3_9BACT|nr:type II toxin-antitoxin system antitoxin SocA domain-containing protein [Adhaeribacter aerolatus]GEO05543.1 hypothetical protein AAE02nite_32070 [Adhaeribacter aerolatus]
MLQLQGITCKIKAFEFFIKQLVTWYKEQNNQEGLDKNDLSRLKVLKLHFFVCASTANEREDGLLGVFDNFWAMPYGHVESDIYKNLENLNYCEITNQRLNIIKEHSEEYFTNLDPIIKREILNSFQIIKSKNKDLINYMAIDLVELSHSWYSWRAMYKLARSFHKYSLKIPNEMIKSENKQFSLQSA